MKNIFCVEKIFISKNNSRKIFEHLCRSKIFQRFQISYLENRAMSLNVRKLQHRKTILYIRDFIQNPLVYKGSQIRVFIYEYSYLRTRTCGTAPIYRLYILELSSKSDSKTYYLSCSSRRVFPREMVHNFHTKKNWNVFSDF